jgi:hypothetical protein
MALEGFMADGQPLLAPDIYQQQQQLQARQALAQSLMQQGMNNGGTESVGGVAIRNNPINGVANMLAAYLGGRAQNINNQESADLMAKRQQMMADTLRNGFSQLQTNPTAGVTTLASNPDTAAYAKALAPEIYKPKPDTTKDMFGKYTPESIAIYQKTQNMADLKPVTEQLTLYQQADIDRKNQELQLRRMEIDQRNKAAQEAKETGKIPPGYRQTADGNLEAIPGGPADLKLQGALNQDTAMLNGSLSSFDRLAEATNGLLNAPGLAGITGIRGSIPNIPGSQAADAEAKLNTLKSQVGFGVLQDLRNNSKTGGALGAVSDAEGKRLEANLASLEKAQSLEQMKESLGKILQYANDAKDRVRAAYNLKHGETAPPSSRAPASPTLSPEDQAAMDWAKANPNDPRATAIMQLHGGK